MCSIGARSLCAAILLLCFFSAAIPAFAIDIWTDEEERNEVSLDVALKASALFSRAPNDPILYPERTTGIGLFRARFNLSTRHDEWMNTELAYEQRARITSEDAGAAGGGILPSGGEAPYRIGQLDWELAEDDDTFIHRHEVDRALVALHPGWGEVIIGRQAIGLGRGVLFGAVDVFSPFSPAEVDREWRRGVDAARVEYRISDTTSAEALAAFGEHWDDSALLGRLRGYIGNIDGELIFGKRAEDIMYAGTMSAVVRDAEVHVELAAFDTPEAHPDGGLFGNDHLIGKAVAGASYTFNVGNGLTLIGEYHYSGLGVEDIKDATPRLLLDLDFQERFLRGDSQILGQHAVAVQWGYPFTDILGGGLLFLLSPVDGSGLAIPSLRWDATEHVSLVMNGYIPWGEKSSGGILGSEYGSSPASLFLQLSAYF